MIREVRRSIGFGKKKPMIPRRFAPLPDPYHHLREDETDDSSLPSMPFVGELFVSTTDESQMFLFRMGSGKFVSGSHFPRSRGPTLSVLWAGQTMLSTLIQLLPNDTPGYTPPHEHPAGMAEGFQPELVRNFSPSEPRLVQPHTRTWTLRRRPWIGYGGRLVTLPPLLTLSHIGYSRDHHDSARWLISIILACHSSPTRLIQTRPRSALQGNPIRNDTLAPEMPTSLSNRRRHPNPTRSTRLTGVPRPPQEIGGSLATDRA